MKYYAVTEDPRELYHYGVKGMKWGQHIFGDKPKSPGYHKALSKLKTLTNKGSKIMKVAKSNIQKSAAQIAYNRRAAQDRKYEKAVQKSQRQTLAVANLSNFIGNENNRNQLNREISAQRKADVLQLKRSNLEQRNAIREERKAIKAEKKFNKYMQEAREGNLRYGRLSDDQIQRVQDRLALEANTRRLGGTEKPSWRQQKKEARRAGYLQGLTKGTSAAMEEVGRAAAVYGIQHIVDRKKLNAKAKQEGKQNKIKNREQNSKSHSDIKREISDELYEAQVRSSEGVIRRNFTGKTSAQKAKALANIQRQARIQEKYQNYLDEHGLDDKAARKELQAKLIASGATEESAKKEANMQGKKRSTIASQQARLLSAVKDSEAEKERKNKSASKLEEAREKKYQDMLDDVGGTDEENRRAFRNTLGINELKRFDSMSERDQRNEVLNFYERQKKMQKAVNEGVERFNNNEQENKIRKAYDNLVAATTLSGFKGGLFDKNNPGIKALSYDELKRLRAAGLLNTGGNNGGKK